MRYLIALICRILFLFISLNWSYLSTLSYQKIYLIHGFIICTSHFVLLMAFDTCLNTRLDLIHYVYLTFFHYSRSILRSKSWLGIQIVVSVPKTSKHKHSKKKRPFMSLSYLPFLSLTKICFSKNTWFWQTSLTIIYLILWCLS